MDLAEFIKRNRNARKIFGKGEIRIIEKQIKGIKLTQSEKNRLSRDIRKKFEFIKEASKFEKEFNLKKGAEIKRIVDETLEIILEHPLRKKIMKVLLFGSVIKNQVTIKSDIDIAIEFDKITLREATRFRINISSKANDKVDIQVFNILPKKIKKEILNNHKILFQNEPNKR